MKNKFQLILNNHKYHDKLYIFLQNIFNILPENKFFNLIKENTTKLPDEQDIYIKTQQEISTIKPFMADIRYGLPALFKQKAVIVKQTKQLIDKNLINGYLEIGTSGRYIPSLKKQFNLKENLYIANDQKPSYGPLDIIDRGNLFINFKYINLSDYSPINLPENHVDMISCYIGLHHIPLDKLDKFIHSIYQTLKPCGKFILRDHDCDSDDMINFVSLIHTVFNLGSGVRYQEEMKELRHFRSLDEWIDILSHHGLIYQNRIIYQDNDPSKNGLMLFTKQ